MSPQASAERSRQVASVVLALNVLVASGFSIAGLVKPELIAPVGATPDAAATIFAMYAAARTLPLAVVALIAIYRRSIPALLLLGVLAGVIQASDGLIGLSQHDLGKSIGPFVIAAVQFFAVYRLNKAARQA
jgi:hypothetical protein